ncbi:MAG: hypothetical protein IAE80_29100 [Anaerolinea sp.]|nr:hypothetical protein [Anaerolinea sp.]
MKLMIVETPAKGRTLAAALGKGWQIEPCFGTLQGFPEDTLGIDLTRDFRPTLRLLPGKGNRLRKLSRFMHAAEVVYFATIPGVEGEALAWELLELAQLPADKPVFRLDLPALDKATVTAAIQLRRELDPKLRDAHQARLLVDRLFSYHLAPLVSKVLGERHTISRLQAILLRGIGERERTAAGQPGWTISARFQAHGVPFDAALYTRQRGLARLNTQAQAEGLRDLLSQSVFTVARTAQTARTRLPRPPFTTLSLIQAAAGELGLAPDTTLALAQLLYESGWIMFYHTTSTHIPPDAVTAARDFILRAYGAEALPPPTPPSTATAGEAIRPTDVTRLPDQLDGAGAPLYALIWTRFVAAHMLPARYTLHGALIHVGKSADQPYPLDFRVHSTVIEAEGFLKVDPALLPKMTADLSGVGQGDTLTPVELQVQPVEAQIQPATGAALLADAVSKHLCTPEQGVEALTGLIERGYLQRADGHLQPTEHGVVVSDYLRAEFPTVTGDRFNAQSHSGLEHSARGNVDHVKLVRWFWTVFRAEWERAKSQTGTRVREEAHE